MLSEAGGRRYIVARTMAATPSTRYPMHGQAHVLPPPFPAIKTRFLSITSKKIHIRTRCNAPHSMNTSKSASVSNTLQPDKPKEIVQCWRRNKQHAVHRLPATPQRRRVERIAHLAHCWIEAVILDRPQPRRRRSGQNGLRHAVDMRATGHVAKP